MYNLLIADDEPKVCSLIQYAVDYPALGLEVIGVAHNGLTALEMIGEYQVDIVITDIRMPGCDGLELIEKAKAINQQISFIIISGHRQFDYAHKAIRFGVEDYLLKPIEEKELTNILRKMVTGRESDRAVREQQHKLKNQLEKDHAWLRKTFIETFIRNPEQLSSPLSCEKINETYHCHFAAGWFWAVTIKADISKRERQSETYRLLERQVQRIAEAELQPGCHELLSCIAPEGVFLLLNTGHNYEKELRKRLKRIRANICTLRDLFWDISATAGIGGQVTSLAAARQSVDAARRAILNRIYLGVNHTIGTSDETGSEISVAELLDSQMRFALNEAVETLNETAVIRMLAKIKRLIQKEGQIDGLALLRLSQILIDTLVLSLKKMCADTMAATLKADFLREYYMCTSVDEVFDAVGDSFIKAIRQAAEDKELNETRPIRIVKKYIQEHYNEVIKLEDVSSLTGFNANYFSGMFKEQAGMNFSEYVTHIRIEKAKHLLIGGDMAVTEIAVEIGYGDAKYFSKIFKKSTGLTPMEFSRLYQKIG